MHKTYIDLSSGKKKWFVNLSEGCKATKNGTWNVHTLRDAFKVDNLLRETSKLKIDISSVAERYRKEIPKTFDQSGYVIIKSS